MNHPLSRGHLWKPYFSSYGIFTERKHARQGGQQRIDAKGREGQRKLFDAFGQMLEGKGIVAREGSIVDPSFVDAPRQRNDRDANQRNKKGDRPEEFDTKPAVGRQKDSEARWTKKNAEVHYGWKKHVKADLNTKVILSSTTTPASVHDSQVIEELLDDKDQAGDALIKCTSCIFREGANISKALRGASPLALGLSRVLRETCAV